MTSKLNPLRLTRLEIGLIQWDVARETGIHQALLSLYERELRTPNDSHKETLAKFYSKKVGELWK
jgi:hypothetical protein